MKIHIDIPLEQKNFNTKKRIFAPNILEKDFADACLKEIKELDLPLMNHPNSKNPYEVVNENFAWRFHKTNQIDKYGKNLQALLDFIKIELPKYAYKITEKPVKYHGNPQVTKYNYDCFLSPHSDNVGWRSLAYYFYFNDNWKPDWGGNTMFIENNKIVDTMIPYHNCFSLFDVEVTTRHFVSPVTKWAQSDRYALGGWLSVEDPDLLD